MTHEELSKIVEDAALALGEHFEAVQILVSNCDSDGTAVMRRGVGNFYARVGMAQEFIDLDKNEMLSFKVAEALNPEDEE